MTAPKANNTEPRQQRSSLPCDELVAPLPLLAVVVLAVNDHILKYTALAHPWTTGKLSDFAGLFFFPLLLTAVFNTSRALVWAARARRWPEHRRFALRRWQLAAACVLTAVMFAFLKLSEPAGNGLASGLETLMPWADFRFVADPTDLIALVMLPLAYLYGRRRALEPGDLEA